MTPLSYLRLSLRVGWCKAIGLHNPLTLFEPGGARACSHCGELTMGSQRLLGRRVR